MKKNLQLALAIMLGLATTAVTAQDWTVDSETRMTNMSTDDAEKNNDSEQFMRMGVSWGDETVSVNASFNGYADLNNFDGKDAATFGIHEAYASTDVMGFATLSGGRMALEFGSGMIIGSNDWENDGNTWDGLMVDLNNDFADISFGMARFDSTNEASDYSDNFMLLNASKEMDAMSFDFTYMSDMMDNGTESGTTAMGLEGMYSLDMGANLHFAYYSATEDMGATEKDMGLTSIGASYEVMDGLTAHASYNMFDENGFHLTTSNVLGAGNGTGAFIVEEEGTQMTFGADYNMGDFSFGLTMYNFESEDEVNEQEAMDFGASYTFNENASLGIKYSTGSRNDVDAADMMWMSLNVSF